jgi:hypothetical protein
VTSGGGGFAQLTTANLMSDSKVLAQKKKQFFLNELVKCPHEDHTYAISSNSIAMALQSSNIFNQNNTSQNLSAFLGQVKDIQMNPKLQKILGKAIEDENSSHSTATAEMTTVSPPRHALISSSATTTTTTTQQVTSVTAASTDFCNVSGGDTRDCFTCEGDSGVCGRLLPFDSYWVHINCLLWSEDITVLNEHMIDPIESILLRMKTVCATLSINRSFDQKLNKKKIN